MRGRVSQQAQPPHMIEMPVGDKDVVNLAYRFPLQLKLNVWACIYDARLVTYQGQGCACAAMLRICSCCLTY